MTPRRIIDDIALCLVFFTRLPLPRFEFGARTLGEAIWAAPIAGLVVGLAGGLVYVATVWFGVSFLIAGGLALAATMLASGCLHEDGLSDVADGFGGGAKRERKLEIMRDSRIGAYGAAALMMSMLLRWSALISLVGPSLVFWSLIAAHTASRAFVPAFMHIMPPAQTDGLAAGAGKVEASAAYTALAIGAVVLLVTIGVTAALIAAIVLALVFFAFRALCLRQIGGQTGDTLGAVQQLGEIAVLVVAATVLG